ETVGALARCPDRREGALLHVAAIGAEAGVARDVAVSQREERPVAQLAHPQRDAGVLGSDLECSARGGEEDLVAATAEPQRPGDAAGGEDCCRLALGD